MPQRRKKRISRLKQLELEKSPVETDLRYWLHHIFHWHLLLLVTCAILFMGYSTQFDYHY
ncbi:MAG: hypothetical protein RDU25_00805 [Patescibacteria group bacterium]|nr:hypothetical protein [Patescibacteria group bacterium]